MPHSMKRWPLRYATSHKIHAAALADGQNVSHAAVYVIYALLGTPAENIYGTNTERLRKFRAAIDPDDVMDAEGRNSRIDLLYPAV